MRMRKQNPSGFCHYPIKFQLVWGYLWTSGGFGVLLLAGALLWGSLCWLERVLV